MAFVSSRDVACADAGANACRLVDVREVVGASREEQRFLTGSHVVALGVALLLVEDCGALVGAVVGVHVVCMVQNCRIVHIVEYCAMVIFLESRVANVFLEGGGRGLNVTVARIVASWVSSVLAITILRSRVH